MKVTECGAWDAAHVEKWNPWPFSTGGATARPTAYLTRRPFARSAARSQVLSGALSGARSRASYRAGFGPGIRRELGPGRKQSVTERCVLAESEAATVCSRLMGLVAPFHTRLAQARITSSVMDRLTTLYTD